MAKLVHLLTSIRTEAAAGLVYAYDPGTTTPGTYLYTDNTLGTPHSNPATLDANGMLVAYCSDTANFRLRIRNAADDTTIDDWDPADSSGGTTLADLTVGTGSALDTAFTAGSAETVDDVIEFLWQNQSNKSAAATAKDLKLLHTGTGAVGRYAYQRISDRYNIKDFGAVGDDSTDNQAAIQAAIDACAAAASGDHYPGGAVFIPGGIFRVSSNLSINNQDNVAIIGDGPGSIIKATFSNDDVFTVEGTSDGIEFASFQIQGAGGAGTTTAVGISVEFSVGDTAGEIPVNIHDMVFSGPSDGTGLNVGVECIGDYGSVTNCTFQRIYHTTSGYAVNLNAGKGWRIANNTCRMVDGASARGAYGIAASASSSDDNQVNNNFVDGAAVAGIYWTGSDGVAVNNNRVQDCAGPGIWFASTDNFACHGNTCEGNTGAGIYITADSQGFAVSGNACQSNTTHGIFLLQTADDASVPRKGVVQGNACRLNSQNGIRLEGASFVLVQGNQVSNDTGGTNNSYPGILVDDAVPVATSRGGASNAIIGNMVNDVAGALFTAPISIVDTTTTIVIGNNFPAPTGGTATYLYDVANRTPPNWIANSGNGFQMPRAAYTSSDTLTASQSGSIITNVGATGSVTMTLPDLTNDKTTDGLTFVFVRAAAQNFVVAAGSGDSIKARDGNAGSITLTGSTDQMFTIYSMALVWYADCVDYTT